MADGVWKGVQPQVIGHFEPLSLNKFFDPSTPSMRKGRDGGEKSEMKKMKENNGGNSGHFVVASRPPNSNQLQRSCSCQNDCQAWISQVRFIKLVCLDWGQFSSLGWISLIGKDQIYQVSQHSYVGLVKLGQFSQVSLVSQLVQTN